VYNTFLKPKKPFKHILPYFSRISCGLKLYQLCDAISISIYAISILLCGLSTFLGKDLLISNDEYSPSMLHF